MVHDVLGRAFTFPSPPRRVVSLVPSLTESLFDLGSGSSLVGATDFCIHPATLPSHVVRVGGTKNPRVDQIRELQPDLVLCNIEENLERHARAIETFAPVFLTEPRTIIDVEQLLLSLGELFGVADSARRTASDLRDACDAAADGKSFTFACAIWKEPWMWCGGDTYVSNLLSAAGGANVLASASRYPAMSIADMLELRPEVIVLPDEPYRFTAADHAHFPSGQKILGPFAGDLVTWHGTRTVVGLRLLTRAVAEVLS